MLLVDTGVLVAVADRNDRDHGPCVELLKAEQGPLITSPLIIAEAGYLIERQLGPAAEASFYRSIDSGAVRLQPLSGPLLQRIAELIEQYADMPLGGADASLVAIAEIHTLDRIATLDNRHFAVVQPRTGPLHIVPG